MPPTVGLLSSSGQGFQLPCSSFTSASGFRSELDEIDSRSLSPGSCRTPRRATVPVSVGIGLQLPSVLQASRFRRDVTAFRLNARPRPKIGSEPAFRRNEAERVYTIEAAHNPEVAGSNPAPATDKGPGNRAFSRGSCRLLALSGIGVCLAEELAEQERAAVLLTFADGPRAAAAVLLLRRPSGRGSARGGACRASSSQPPREERRVPLLERIEAARSGRLR